MFDASYLQVMPDNEEQKRFAVGSRYLTACFAQPGGASNFLQRVADQKVVLENCLVDDTDMLVTGSVRVANVAYHKKVQFSNEFGYFHRTRRITRFNA